MTGFWKVAAGNLVALFSILQWFDFSPFNDNQVNYFLTLTPSTPQNIMTTVTIVVAIHQFQYLNQRTLLSRECLARLVSRWINILKPSFGYGNRWRTLATSVENSMAGSLLASLRISSTLPSWVSFALLVQCWIDILGPSIGSENRLNAFVALAKNTTAGGMLASLRNSTTTVTSAGA